MTSTIRQRRYIRTSTKGEYGNKATILDRRKRALSLRAQGHSYRSIAEQLGIDLRVAWTDCNHHAELLADDLSAEAIRAELLEIHRLATGALVEDLQRQSVHGQVETVTNANGDSVTKVKRWLNPQTAAELGRTCQRIAQLLGLTETGPDDQAAAASQTNIVLLQPGDPSTFSQRAEALAAARQAEPQPIDVQPIQETPEPAQGEPEASAQPEAAEPATEAPEPLWRANLRARRQQALEALEPPIDTPAEPKARTGAARGRSEPYRQRVLPAPVRN